MVNLFAIMFAGCTARPAQAPRPVTAILTGEVHASEAETPAMDASRAALDPSAEPPLPEPQWTVDVLVIGSGPAGLAAAWEATQAGADVLVLEAASDAGGNGRFANHMFAAGSDTQVKRGIEDSPAAALDEWETITAGGDPTDPAVRNFVEQSYETLVWMQETFDITHDELLSDTSAGEALRVHVIKPTINGRVTDQFLTRLDGRVWTEKPAVDLVLDHGRVVGARLDEIAPDAWIRASATVVATGGFARDATRLLDDRPELADTDYVVEIGYTTQGGGHAMLEQVGADFHNEGNYGVYLHSMRDWREGYETEAAVLTSAASGIIVDSAGERVTNEEQTTGFQMMDHLLETSDYALFALFPRQVYRAGSVTIPGYNIPNDGTDEPSTHPMTELASLGVLSIYPGLDQAAADLGIDADALEETVARYDALVTEGEDSDFGKSSNYLLNFSTDPVMGVKLVPGVAKAFTGVRTDADARVLLSSGEAVPGLYAAGEVAGTLGTDAVGEGFSGSLAACYFMGRVAGAKASAYAASWTD